jgi:hypothetical protein
MLNSEELLIVHEGELEMKTGLGDQSKIAVQLGPTGRLIGIGLEIVYGHWVKALVLNDKTVIKSKYL